MNAKDFSEVALMRVPDKSSGKLLKKLRAVIENKYNVKFGDYWDFHKWTVDHLCEYWAEMWEFIEVIASKKFDKVIDLNIPMSEVPEWFPGAKLNTAENLLKYRDDHIALICAGENREPERITYAQMYEEAKLYAAAFRKCGLQKGDRVACFISNRKEAIFAMQAVISIGAIWSAVLPLLGSKVVINRFKQIEPKILFTIDSFVNGGKEINMLHKISEIVEDLPSLEKVIIVTPKKDLKSSDISKIKSSCILEEFLKIGRTNGTVPDMEFEQVSFSHPNFISFTSGTSGKPKAMTHGFGCLFASCRDFWLHADASRDCVWFIISPAGWASWNMLVTLNFVGLTLLLYEGVPYFRSSTYIWDKVDEFGVTHMTIPANVLDEYHKTNLVPGGKNHLSSLKCIVSAGSIVKPAIYDFVYEKIKKDVVFSAIFGATEVIGVCIVLDQTLPIYRGEIPTPSFGNNIETVDEKGKSIFGEAGELLITTPSPALLTGLWRDDEKILFKKSYFSKYSDKFAIGDAGVINPVTKGIRICGRCDETLKQRGTRFGSIEIYSVLDNIREIKDSLCVGQYNKELDERAVLFIKMKEGELFDEKLVEKIRQVIKKELTESHIPEVILEVPDIPYNLNGKKMEILVKKMINSMPYNSETVVNSESLKYFANVPPFEVS